jgi:hypothetical protein
MYLVHVCVVVDVGDGYLIDEVSVRSGDRGDMDGLDQGMEFTCDFRDGRHGDGIFDSLRSRYEHARGLTCRFVDMQGPLSLFRLFQSLYWYYGSGLSGWNTA